MGKSSSKCHFWRHSKSPHWPPIVILCGKLVVGTMVLDCLGVFLYNPIWAVFFFGCLYSCFAYATVCAMPTQPQWEPTRLIPLKGQRPCKTMPQRTCLPTLSHSRLLLEVWKRNFCVREHSPINVLLSGMPCGTLQGHHQRLQTAPCSRTQTPKRP